MAGARAPLDSLDICPGAMRNPPLAVAKAGHDRKLGLYTEAADPMLPTTLRLARRGPVHVAAPTVSRPNPSGVSSHPAWH